MDHVPVLSILFMGVSAAVAFGIPVGLFLYLKIRKKTDVLPFVIGCAVMLLFVMVLERLVHGAVLGSSAGEAIRNNPILYGLYGGAMAGIFEETGRYLAFRTILRRSRWNDANALMYGAGHGGIEAAALLGSAMMSNLTLSIIINAGGLSSITAGLSGDTLAQIEDGARALITTPSWQFLAGAIERVFAIALHLSFSVLVWFAAKKKERIWLYPLAILLHLLTDGVMAVLSGYGAPLLLVEGVIALFAAVSVWIARKVWEKESVPAILPDYGHGSSETEAG